MLPPTRHAHSLDSQKRKFYFACGSQLQIKSPLRYAHVLRPSTHRHAPCCAQILGILSRAQAGGAQNSLQATDQRSKVARVFMIPEQ